MDFFTRHNAYRRRLSHLDPASGLFCTHQFAHDATAIDVASGFPDRAKPVTVSTIIHITNATPAGVILELGSAVTGLALWIAAADRRLYGAAGDAAADDGLTVTGPVCQNGQHLRITFAVVPGAGKGRLWVNGMLVGIAYSTNKPLPNGWSSDGAGAVGQVDTDITTRVALGDRIQLAGASIVAPVNVYHNQTPRETS